MKNMGASPSSEPTRAELDDGRYRLESALGDAADGRFAGVAHDGTRVTIELVDGGEDPAALVAKLMADPAFSTRDGPHVASVLEVGLDERTGRVFLVLPSFEGTDARRLISERGPLELQVAVRVILQACHGVAELQAAGAGLTELRPSDLLLVNGAAGEVTVEVAPVSSARAASFDRSSLSGTDGVPFRSFVAPERPSATETRDERSTVWSLGACLYWLLSASSPGADTGNAGNVVSVQDVAPWVNPGLTIALHLALQADPAQRWPTISAFANALLPYSGGDERMTVDSLAPIERNARRRVAERADPKALGLPASEGSVSNTNTASSTGLFGKLSHEPAGLAALIDRTLDGRWKMLRVIGRGGMGAVFEVEGPGGEHRAAKLIDRRHIGEDEETYKRFFREAKSAGLIDSPHVVRTIETGLDSELKAPFIIMELLSGVDLKSVLRERGPLTAEPVVRMFVQAARGIADAHRQHIIHRDIKPANLFLHEGADKRVTVKVCDFGIAKRAADVDGDQTGSHDLTRTGGMLGSPLYMSPEQATNARNVDHRTDIWSLCISLYEALSGTKPWAGRSALGEIIVAICTQQVPPLTRAAPWLDRDLARVVHRGLLPDLGDRYATVEELIAELEPFLGGSEEFTFADLEPVPSELRALKPSSLPPPPPDQEAATVMGGVLNLKQSSQAEQAANREVRRRSRKVSMALGVVAVAAVAVAVVAVTRSPRAPAPAPVAASTAAVVEPSAAPPPSSHAAVKIVPPNAIVTVDGRSVQVTNGEIELSGLPGTAFEVVVTLDGGTHKSESVVLSREGAAVPDTVVVEEPSTPGRRFVPRVGSKLPGEHPAGTSPTSAPTAKPTSEPVHQPEFKNEW
jgi:serine/threonine protein kinase